MNALTIAISGSQKARAPANSMANMAVPAETKMGSGAGKVIALEKAAA
jgi:hypothetical protein